MPRQQKGKHSTALGGYGYSLLPREVELLLSAGSLDHYVWNLGGCGECISKSMSKNKPAASQ